MITILGATGFIGSNIVKKLKIENKEYFAPKRDEDLSGINLDNIIYCIGLTADFRTKPFETVESHICKLNYILSKCNFNSLTYLSSTRVYINSLNEVAKEEDKITVDPLDFEELYTLTKLTGERLCLSSNKNVKIARLSNVVGSFEESNNFLSNIITEIISNGRLELHQSLNSEKDYIHIDDVVEVLIRIATSGKQNIYNIASGKNLSNQEILEEIRQHYEFDYFLKKDAKQTIFPKISNSKICDEFNFMPKEIINQILNKK